MSDDIERRLRESLRARAQDVEPTPELFTRVENTMNKNKRWTAALSAAGFVAAAAVAAVAIPNLLDDGDIDRPIVDQPTEAPTPSTGPTVEPSPTPTQDEGYVGALPDHVVLAGDDRIWIEDVRTGDEVAELVNVQSPENESDIVAVEIRPGSTAMDLALVYLQAGEGQVWFRYLIYRDGEVVADDFLPDAYQVSPDAVSDAMPVPAFDETGNHLAWIEVLRGEENQTPTLRTIGWTREGPGTGDRATDNASFSLDQLTAEFPGGFQVEDWIWTDEVEGGRSGVLFATSGAVEAFLIRIDEQPDGALAMDSNPVQLIERQDGALVDFADAHVSPGAAVGPEYNLVVRSAGTQDAEGVEWTLTFSGDGDRSFDRPVPEFISQTASPGDVTMVAYGDAYAITMGGRTVIYTPNGEREVAASAVDFLYTDLG